METEASASHIL